MPTKTYPHYIRAIRRFTGDNLGDASPPTTSQTTYDRSWSDSFSGSDLPQYKFLLSHGGNATTGASGVVEVYSIPSGSAYLEWKDFGNPNNRVYNRVDGYLVSGIPVPVDPAGLQEGLADTQARLKFMSKVRSSRTAFQGGTFFGELAQTLRMLKSPAKALRDGFDHYAQAAKKRAARRGLTTKKRNAIVAETWLEYSYGWIPLSNDISDLVEAARGSRRTYSDPIRAEVTLPAHAEHLDDAKDGDQNVIWRYKRRHTGEVSVRYLGAVGGEVGEPSFAEFVGFNPSNFLPTVWNLIPYSFLVDYFTNIGDLIDGMSQGTVFLRWGCKTVVKRSTFLAYNFHTKDSDFSNFGSNFVRAYASGSDYRAFRKTFSRSRVDAVGVGLSDFQFRLPGITSTRWLNIAALAQIKSL